MDIQKYIENIEDIPLDSLSPFQSIKLKKLSNISFKRLYESIKADGVLSPFFVFKEKEKVNIIDGHQRYKVLRKIENENSIKINVKCIVLSVDSEKAKELILQYSHHFPLLRSPN